MKTREKRIIQVNLAHTDIGAEILRALITISPLNSPSQNVLKNIIEPPD